MKRDWISQLKIHQIDRIENNLNESGNIDGSTVEKNARNKRETHNHASDPINKKRTPTYHASTFIKIYGGEVCMNGNQMGTDN